MQSFFISIANLLSQIWDFISNSIKSFFALLDYLKDSISFVVGCAGKLPLVVQVPCTVILGVMVIKFFLSFGKQ